MKIALVAEWLDRSRGGAETSTIQCIEELRRRGVLLEVFTRSEIPPKPGMKVHTIRPLALGRAISTHAFLVRAAEKIRSSGCDLTHALIPCGGADIYQPRGGLVAETIRRTIASRSPGVSRVLKGLDLATNARQHLLLRKERSWLRGPTKPIVVALSHYVVRQLREHYHYPNSHIRYIFNGVCVEESDPQMRARDRRAVRSAFGIEPDALLLLQVCHNFHLKGVGSLIRALARVEPSSPVPIRALVAGGGQRRPWSALARRLGLEGKVRFTGALKCMTALFHASDVLVHPTYYDPCSRVVLEGLCHGLPIISTRFDGASEVLEEGVTGFVLDSPSDLDEFARRLRLLTDRDRRSRMSDAVLHQAADVSMARHVEELCQLYRSLIP